MKSISRVARYTATFLMLIGMAVAGAGPVAAQTAADLLISVDPATIVTEVGQTTQITVTTTNESSAESAPLSIHVDITNPGGTGSVDPEDWTAELTRQIGSIGPGETSVTTWDLKPIAGGEFSLFATVFAEAGGSDIFVSNAVDVSVASRRSLNPDGVLPVVIAMPALVVGAVIVRRRFV